MEDITKISNSELLEAYKIVSNYIKELEEKIKVSEND